MSDKRGVYKIFLSSPGDVNQERDDVQAVIEEINRSCEFDFDIKLFRWDDPQVVLPMPATQTPQKSVDMYLCKPSDCDLVIGIFWSRIGTPLIMDGTEYLSGTHYEISEGIRSNEKSGKPLVWLYRCQDEPSVSLKNPKRTEIIKQFDLVEQYFSQFRDDAGRATAGANFYPTHSEFKDIFGKQILFHLRHLKDNPIVETIKRIEAPESEMKEKIAISNLYDDSRLHDLRRILTGSWRIAEKRTLLLNHLQFVLSNKKTYLTTAKNFDEARAWLREYLTYVEAVIDYLVKHEPYDKDRKAFENAKKEILELIKYVSQYGKFPVDLFKPDAPKPSSHGREQIEAWYEEFDEIEAWLQGEKPDYQDLLLRLQIDEETHLPADIEGKRRQLLQTIKDKQQEEAERLREQAQTIFNSCEYDLRHKEAALEDALDSRFESDAVLRRCLEILKGAWEINKRQMLREHLKCMFANNEKMLDRKTFDDARACLRQNWADVEAVLRYLHDTKADLREILSFETFLTKIHTSVNTRSIGHYAYSSRVMERNYLIAVKEFEKRIRQTGSDIDIIDSEEVNLRTCIAELRQEYAWWTLAQAMDKFAAATGLDKQTGARDWLVKPHLRQLNPKSDLDTILKDIKLGLINLDPGKYLSLFPEITVEGDRSENPSYLMLSEQAEANLYCYLEALEEAFQLAQDIQKDYYAIIQTEVEDLENIYKLVKIFPKDSLRTVFERLLRQEQSQIKKAWDKFETAINSGDLWLNEFLFKRRWDETVEAIKENVLFRLQPLPINHPSERVLALLQNVNHNYLEQLDKKLRESEFVRVDRQEFNKLLEQAEEKQKSKQSAEEILRNARAVFNYLKEKNAVLDSEEARLLELEQSQ